MTHATRQQNDRRAPDRRSFEPAEHVAIERRAMNRRGPTDRRNDPYWRFSWLRTSVCQQLSG